MKFGTKQGRLVPPEGGRFNGFPRERWADEPRFANLAGLQTLEWIYDRVGEGINPLETDAAAQSLLQLCAGEGIQIGSVCADWFMDFPLVHLAPDDPAGWPRLHWLMRRCESLSIGRIVLPFLDASSLKTPAQIDVVLRGLERVLGANKDCTVELDLEADFNPDQFASFLKQIEDPRVCVNYDCGNSASLGFDPKEEFDAYGARVGGLHIKDRLRGGSTVPLGQGSCDFDAVVAGLKQSGYEGDCVFEIARGVPGDEVAWTRANLRSVKSIFSALIEA